MPKVQAPDTCRLTIAIRGDLYVLRRASGRAWYIHKDGDDPSPVYHVTTTGCSCPDHRFKHNTPNALMCKHHRALRAVGLLD